MWLVFRDAPGATVDSENVVGLETVADSLVLGGVPAVDCECDEQAPVARNTATKTASSARLVSKYSLMIATLQASGDWPWQVLHRHPGCEVKPQAVADFASHGLARRLGIIERSFFSPTICCGTD